MIPFCTENNYNIKESQLDLDQLGHELLQQIKDATRFLVRKVAGNNKKLKASFQKAGKNAYASALKEFNDHTWIPIWRELTSTGQSIDVTNLCKANCDYKSNVEVKKNLNASANKLSSYTLKLLKKTPKNASAKIKKELAKRKKKLAGSVKQFSEISKIIPDNVCK